MNRDAAFAARAGVAFVAALVVVGCSDTSGLDAIEDAAVRDMALVAADAAVEDVNSWARPFGFGTGGPPGPGGGGFRGRGLPGGHHQLGGPGSGTISETFYDAAGNEQAEFDELTTERIDLVTVVSGEVAREDWTAVIHRERSMTFTGLSGEETHRTINGSGLSEVTRSRHTDDGDRTYHMTGAATYADVVAPIPGAEPPYPISGSISRSMTSTRTDADGSETREMELTIIFDGDETATVIVNGETMEIDLSARGARRPIPGRRGG